NHDAFAALDGGHDHRNLRLPARRIRVGRCSALPELREADYAAIERADRAGDSAGRDLQARRPDHDPGAHCSRKEGRVSRSEEHTSELQSPCNLVCRLLLEKKKTIFRLTHVRTHT